MRKQKKTVMLTAESASHLLGHGMCLKQVEDDELFARLEV